MNELVEGFLYKVLGGRQIKTLDLNDLINMCIQRAYRDMLNGGRFVIGNHNDEQLSDIRQIFKKYNYTFDRMMIDDVAIIIHKEEKIEKNGRFVTRYGLAQKIVNMTFIYFYLFNDFLKKNGLIIDYSNCDCPLDSIVLNDGLKHYDIAWTRMNKEQYIAIQNEIKQKEFSYNIGNLEYDFINW